MFRVCSLRFRNLVIAELMLLSAENDKICDVDVLRMWGGGER